MRLRQTAMTFAVVGVVALTIFPMISTYAQSDERLTDLRGRVSTVEEIACAMFPEDCRQAQAPDQGEATRGVTRPPITPPVPKASAEPKPVVLNINFASNSDEISPRYYAELNKLGEVLSRHSQTRVEIAGYTDSRGSFTHNQLLSERRAESVKQYLVAKFSIAPEHVIAKGYGPAAPIAPNDTPAGREKNRRVQAERMK